MFGFFAVFCIGMLPVSFIFHVWTKPEGEPLCLGDYAGVLGLSAALVFGCMLAGTMLFGGVGLVISWFSEDAANSFIRFTTVMRE
jgi:hypothetical protein